MATRTALKAFFETGDTPTQAQFASLIDSVPNITDDLKDYESKVYIQDITVSGEEQNFTLVDVGDKYFLPELLAFQVLSVTGSSEDDTKVITVNQLSINESLSYLASNPLYLVETSNYTATSDVTITCDPLPTGISAMSLRVILKGILIPTT